MSTSPVAALPLSRLQPTFSPQPAADDIPLYYGQPNAVDAFEMAFSPSCHDQHCFALIDTGLEQENMLYSLIQNTLDKVKMGELHDWCYFQEPHAPQTLRLLPLAAGEYQLFESLQLVTEKEGINTALRELQDLLNSDQTLSEVCRVYLQATLDAELQSGDDEDSSIQMPIPLVVRENEQADYPIIFCHHLTCSALFGEIRYEPKELEGASRQYLMPGAMHKANGGVLVLPAEQLLAAPDLWLRLKAALITKQLSWQSQAEAFTLMPYFTPEAMPLSINLVLVGDRYALNAFQQIEDRFDEVFPIVAEFATLVQRERIDGSEYLGFLNSVAASHASFPLQESALAATLPFAARLTEHQSQLSLESKLIGQLFEQATVFARREGESSLAAKHINQAISQQKLRMNLIVEESYQQFVEGTLKIQVTGEKIAQVNGLTVIEVGNLVFGEPARITASVHYGDGDVIDIERKADLAGNIHAKGTMILSAYLASLFAKDAPLHLSASLVFEQSYHEVDGDSASLAELIALLSAIAKVPVKQNMACTGAIDQFGNVQAIGGVNEKIEGFADVAWRIAPEQAIAVILPESNVKHIHLSDKLMKACAAGKLTLYPVQHVSEAVALMTGIEAGADADKRGRYPAESIFGKVQKRFDRLADDDDEEIPPSYLARILSWFFKPQADK